MNIETKLTIASQLQSGSLLTEAATEIKSLRLEIERYKSRESYEPGTELMHLIKAGRINGFRIIFNRSEKEKPEQAKDLLYRLNQATGMSYGGDLYDCLIRDVKTIQNDETIS